MFLMLMVACIGAGVDDLAERVDFLEWQAEQDQATAAAQAEDASALEARVAALEADRDDLQGRVAELEADRDELTDQVADLLTSSSEVYRHTCTGEKTYAFDWPVLFDGETPAHITMWGLHGDEFLAYYDDEPEWAHLNVRLEKDRVMIGVCDWADDSRYTGFQFAEFVLVVD